MEKIKVGIVGLGMVGETLRRWFEEICGYKRGADLFCYDTDVKKGYFNWINTADIIFVAVPTPSNSDGSCDVSRVESVLLTLNDHKIAVIKSTIPPGTTEMLQAKYPHLRILFNPEFLTESRAWEDFLHPVRQLVGYSEKSKGDSMVVLNLLPQGNFSSPWAADYSRFELTATEAEFVKYFSNVFGAVKVTLANIIYDLCQAVSERFNLEINYENIKTAVGADPRIGPAWLNVHHGAYRGFGGFCFPKDLDAFIDLAKKLDDPSLRYSEINGILLSHGEGVLKAVRNYNRTLLISQNHTEEEVSKHDKDIVLEKRESPETKE